MATHPLPRTVLTVSKRDALICEAKKAVRHQPDLIRNSFPPQKKEVDPLTLFAVELRFLYQ
jgi:hypothetical protein